MRSSGRRSKRIDDAESSMSVGRKKKPSPPPSRREEGAEGETRGVVREESGGGGGEKRFGRWFSGLDLSVGAEPLKDADAGKLKAQIRKWARAVVAYARQLSLRSTSSRHMSTGGGGATGRRSATFPSKSSSLGGDQSPAKE